jgi:hypothetical protein
MTISSVHTSKQAGPSGMLTIEQSLAEMVRTDHISRDIAFDFSHPPKICIVTSLDSWSLGHSHDQRPTPIETFTNTLSDAKNPERTNVVTRLCN